MKIILLQSHENLGKTGDIINVKSLIEGLSVTDIEYFFEDISSHACQKFFDL